MASSPSPRKNPPTESAVVVQVQPPSPRLHVTTPTTGAQRRIGIAVDLSDESAFAVKWAVQNYLRSENYNLDDQNEAIQQKIEEDFNLFTSTKANDIAQPLVDANIPFKIHIVKDHDMKERLCLEVERLGLSTVVMGSRGFGASRRSSKGRLGSSERDGGAALGPVMEEEQEVLDMGDKQSGLSLFVVLLWLIDL
ncbi:hypothetical protein OIU78_024585 [Salix suchowensis]|nr:hypothetical protein OIU78_024585 [Salix suchowensis]